MQKLRTFLKDYFSFGKRDRIGLICLVGLIGIIYTLPYLFARKQEPFPARQTAILAKAIDSLALKEQANKKNSNSDELKDGVGYQQSQVKSFTNGALFQFDPNTLSVDGWQRLGLSERTSKTIEKYRSKGGKFYKAEDLQKIWGIPGGFYERVKNYIVINSFQQNYVQTDAERNTYIKPEKKPVIVNINEGDTSAFIALPGIGNKLASRIVSFRDKLGGFYSVDQVGETYGLPDSSFQKIKGSLQLNGSVKKLNVNTATKDELKAHPYIRWNLANAIVEYRNQHGSFKSLDELKNIALIDEGTYQKIIHYLSL